MRRMRISFLMLASIGGCTPLLDEQRSPDEPFVQAQVIVTRQVTAQPPPPAHLISSETPAPAASWDMSSQPRPAAITNLDSGDAVGVTTAKQSLNLVAQAPAASSASAPVPASSAPAQAGTSADGSNIIRESFESRSNKPDFFERVEADVKPLPEAPVPLPSTIVDTSSSAVVQPPAFHMVNTKKFTLNFEVKDVGVTGVSTVDLWGTQDMKTWKKFDSVQQQGNALVVEVKEEGTYGFTLVARNGNGLGKTPPQPGDLPQAWVSVNTTPPAVTLAGVEMSLTSKTPSLIIRWTAKDRNFSPRPVTLSYATNADGPWTLLATNVENTGRFEWPLPAANVPSAMYVRVQAADINGNVGFAQTQSPIHLDSCTAKAELPPELARPATPPPPAADPARPIATILDVEPSQPQ
jgi:hypothetical protein